MSQAGKEKAKAWKGKVLGVEYGRKREAGRDKMREEVRGSSWRAEGVTGRIV